jgi:hypothetical protein
MWHLNPEDLARLVDEAPEPAEAAHLRECLVCRRELSEMRDQTQALASLAGDGPAPGAWDDLEGRLRAEGLIRGVAVTPLRPRWIRTHGLRAAASLALFLLGGTAGAALWNARTSRQMAAVATAPAPAPAAAETRIGTPAESSFAGLMGGTTPQEAPRSSVRLASTAPAAVDTPSAMRPRTPAPRPAPVRVTPRQAEDAARQLLQAQAAYVGALQRYAAIADPNSGNPPETRLAALDRLVTLTAEALEHAPGDPVINGYHLAATAERGRLRRELEQDAQTAWF